MLSGGSFVLEDLARVSAGRGYVVSRKWVGEQRTRRMTLVRIRGERNVHCASTGTV